MPEVAEIKIMSDYINLTCSDKDFTSISFSPSAMDRNMGITQPSDLQIFKIKSKARGKELILDLIQGGDIFMSIRFSMGMSGFWFLSNDNSIPKHTHLIFKSVEGSRLCMVDVRRFAKWKVESNWSINRGPCPLTDYTEFKHHILSNLSKKEFDKPIHIVLMNQKYFNGIGNYLRAEILFKADQDPFESARSAISSNPKIIELCEQLSKESYVLGGGQLKDWENPFLADSKDFSTWIECYGKLKSIIDSNGRRLWFNPKFSPN
jgi:endonuclease VIII-like 1